MMIFGFMDIGIGIASENKLILSFCLFIDSFTLLPSKDNDLATYFKINELDLFNLSLLAARELVLESLRSQSVSIIAR